MLLGHTNLRSSSPWAVVETFRIQLQPEAYVARSVGQAPVKLRRYNIIAERNDRDDDVDRLIPTDFNQILMYTGKAL